MEPIAETSWLSIYSTSGLLKESQVDIVSSKETDDSPSDLLGENSILHCTGGGGNATSFPVGKDGTTLGSKTELRLSFEGGRTCRERPTFVTDCVFLAFWILFELGTF